MTDPGVLESPEPMAIDAAIRALIANAGRLGLKWDLQAATVTGLNPVTIVYDNDTASVGATSMIGPVLLNGRVYALVIPPSGNFIVGFPGPPIIGAVNAQTLVAGSVAASSGPEAAVPSASFKLEPKFLFPTGLIFKVTLTFGAFPSAATDSATLVRIRKGSATTTGTQYVEWQVPLASSEASNLCSHTHIGYVKNALKPVETQLSITNARVNGAATTTLFGDSNIPMILEISSIGTIAQLPGIASIAVQL